MKLCSRLFVLYCRNYPKDKFSVEFLLSVMELLFYLLRLRHYKAKCVKTRCLQEGVGQLEPRFQGKGSSPANILIPLERQLIVLQLFR